MKVQGCLRESSVSSITRLCKMLCHFARRSKSWKMRLKKLFICSYFLHLYIIAAFFETCFNRSTGMVAVMSSFLVLTSVLNIFLESKVPAGLRLFSLVLKILVFGKKTAEFDQLRLEIPCVEYAQNV